MQQNQAALKAWSSSGPYWEKHRETIQRMFAPVTQALVEETQIASGMVVLDVATGPGEPALTLAEIVGPQGKVFGVDPVTEMIAGARRAAVRLERSNTQFDVAFADDLPYPDDAFDAVVCRFGMMFMATPVEAVRGMLRVLKPGRKLALAVWHSEETNPFLCVLQKVVEKYVPPPPPSPDAPDAFRFAEPGKLRDVLEEAGATSISERLLKFRIEAPLSVEDFFAARLEISEKLRSATEHLSGEQMAQVKHESIEALDPYSTGGGISFPSEALIVSGAKD